MRKITDEGSRASSLQIVIALSLLCLSALLFASSQGAPAQSQTGFGSTAPALSLPTTPLGATPTPSCPAVITESSSQTVTVGNSISCNDGTTHRDNSYWRAFDVATFTGGTQYCVSSVSFGIEFANNSQPITVRLYTSSNFPAGFPGSLNQIGSATYTVSSAQNGTVVTAPISAYVPAGTPQLIMELFTPDGQAAGHRFFVGSNSAPETGPSYLSAPACGFTTPTTTATIGFPDMHIVFDVNGACASCPTPTPTPACPTVITQSTSQAITTSFVPCHSGGPMGYGQTDNYYSRVFNMQTFVGGAQFDVSSVSFGVYLVHNTQPLTISLYADGTPIAGTTITLPDGYSGIITTPLVATVPAGTSDLAMQLFTPSAQAAGNRFEVGANLAPETGLSYWRACMGCAIPVDQHFVFNVYGSCVGEGSPPPVATPTPTPTPCSELFAENFDNVVAPALPPGWAVESYCYAPPWVTSTTTPDSGPNDAFIPGDIAGADKRLETPNITIAGPDAEVSFRNSYNLLSCCAGGVLEVSSPNINGGAFTDIIAAGGNFVTGGYNGGLVEDNGGAFPLAGRFTWTGNSGGYINTVVNLGPNVAGQTIKLRFRLGASFASGGAGWRIDTITSVGTCVVSIPSPTPTTTPTPSPTPPIIISGTISYCSNPAAGPVPNVTLTLTGSVSGTTLSDGSGNYMFSVPSGGSYTVTPTKAALAPGASGINTTDVVAVQRHFLNIGTPLSGCRLTAADVNGDALVNTVDVVAIQRFFLVQSTGTANVGRYQFNPVNRSYPGVVSNQTNQNYDALVLGDVATPYVH